VSLADAHPALVLPPGPPYACVALKPGAFHLPAVDPRLDWIERGEAEPCPPLANLVGARRAWATWPSGMDFLDPASPVHREKLLERALYLERWARHIPRGCRVLDLGGGIGRFTTWCLDQGCDVELVDPDLRSLNAALRHCAGRPGRLEIHRARGEDLPAMAPVDAVIAAEVLCYAEDPAAILDRVRTVLRPGGALLLSVEARWGWAVASDVPAGAFEGLETGVVHVPGDRWVRTFDRPELEALLAGFNVEEILPTHYTLSGPLAGLAEGLGELETLAWESRLRAHAVYAPLNRAWTVVARCR
jgi:SAM-dependent methyltransferase